MAGGDDNDVGEKALSDLMSYFAVKHLCLEPKKMCYSLSDKRSVRTARTQFLAGRSLRGFWHLCTRAVSLYTSKIVLYTAINYNYIMIAS